MSTLTMPTLMVAFQQRANTAVARSQKGTVAFVIRDAAANSADQTYALASTGQIPKTLGTANQDAVRRVFQGSPKKVLLYVMGAEAVISAQSPLLTWLGTQKFDYLAGPDDLTAEEAAALKKWVVEQRSDNSAIYKAVLPDTVADSEAIVNFCAQEILAGGETFTAAAYCGRIAGLIAGTPMTQSVTYAALAEVDDLVTFEVDDARTFHWGGLRGRVVTNPPYGERLMERREAEELYRAFGRAWSKFPEGWKLFLLSSHTEFERTFGRQADKKRKLYNGMLKCDLFMYGMK